jgi:hypothetical protein
MSIFFSFILQSDRLCLGITKTGRQSPPLFYLAHPHLTVEMGAETFQVEAKVAEELERTRLYNKMVEMLPGFDDYRRRTERKIPVIELTPVK